MTQTNICDIIIVGAGPAGLSTALHLDHFARPLGLDVLLLEKARHPRPKLCAGGILSEGETILSKLGLDLSEVNHVDVDKAYFNYKGRGLVARFLNKKPLFRIIRRDEFDSWLANKAKEREIEIKEEVRVEKLEIFDNFVLVKTNKGDFRAKIIVGADGSNSIVRRAVEKKPRPHLGRALEVITPVPPQPSPNTESKEKIASFDFLAIPQGISGYVWDFPTKINGKPMRCWGVYDSNTRSSPNRTPLRQVLADEMEKHGYNLDKYELKGHPIRWYEPANTSAISRVILVGDALGVDALLGEGISPALGYGAVAAKAILHAFEKNDFSFKSYKSRLQRSPLGGALWRRTFMAKLFYRINKDRLQSLIWRRFGWAAGLIGMFLVVGWEKKHKKRSDT